MSQWLKRSSQRREPSCGRRGRLHYPCKSWLDAWICERLRSTTTSQEKTRSMTRCSGSGLISSLRISRRKRQELRPGKKNYSGSWKPTWLLRSKTRSFINCVLSALYRVLFHHQQVSKSSFGTLRRAYATAGRWRETTQSDLSDQQMADLVLAVMHGLTALHMANEPNLPVGQGRFGGLISAAVSLFNTAWSRPLRSEGD